MKKLLFSAIAGLFFSTSFSQQTDLVFKSSAKGPYVEHRVAPKEGLYPLSRMYNIHPRHIAAYNKQDYNKGLDIGQLMQIPLTDTNFSKTANKGVPVYYTTIQKETLVNVSVKTSKAPLGNIRTWNNLSNDNIDAGVKLIIGFLITDEMQDRVVAIQDNKKVTSPPVVTEKKEAVAEVKKAEPEVKKEEPKKIVAEIKKETPAVVIEEPKKIEPEVKKEVPIVVKEEPKKIEPERKKEITEIVKETPKIEVEEIVEEGAGFFKNNFNQQINQILISKDQTLTSSIFKTANGWQDAKYYLLINGVEPGTIVKITNPGNNKVLFAKVLYGLDAMRQNQGLDIRISDAAAAALSISETDKFIVKVNY